MLEVDKANSRVQVVGGGSPEDVVDRLVREYSSITGPLGVRLCHVGVQEALRRHPGFQVASFRGGA